MSLSLDRLSSTSNVWTKFRPTWLRRGQSKKHRSPSTSPTPSASSTSSDTSNESDTTSAAPSIAVEIEAKEPPSVVEPQVPAMIVVPQKRASPKSKKQQIIDTSLNTLKISLDLLAKAPFPGADLAAHALIESIKRVQEIKAVAEGLKQLAQRMAMVQPLVATANPSNPSTCAPLLRELEQLALDIDDAAKEGRVAKFFNVNDNASKISKCTQTIDSMMLDLSLSVGLDTHELVKSALDKLKDANKKPDHHAILTLADISTENGRGGGGALLSGNVGTTYFNARKAVLRTGGGPCFSGNSLHGPVGNPVTT